MLACMTLQGSSAATSVPVIRQMLLEGVGVSTNSAFARSLCSQVIFPVLLPEEGCFDWAAWHERVNNKNMC